MPSFCVFPTSDALIRQLNELAGAAKSRRFYTCRQQVAGAVDADHRAGMLRGLTGNNSAVPGAAGVKARRRGRYRGASGPPGVPFGRTSRLYARYGSRWEQQASAWVLIRFVSDFRAAPYLLRRFRYGGIRPQTYAKVKGFVREFLDWYTDPANRGKSS